MHYHHEGRTGSQNCSQLSLEEMQKGSQRRGAGFQGVLQAGQTKVNTE